MRTLTSTTSQRTRYDHVRSVTERLADPLSAEDQTVQSMPDVSPTKWHRAHTTWFFETFLLVDHLPGYDVFDEAFDFLFNSYYESVGPRYERHARGNISRPGIADVGYYRQYVDAAMASLFDSSPGDEVMELVELGLQHEQQHQELLLMDIKHVLSTNPLFPAYQSRSAPALSSVAPPRWLEIDGGLVDIGHDGDGFAFDNESPRFTAWLEPFELADRPVSCGEWLEFVADDGYRRPEFWLSDGWSAVKAGEWSHPLHWHLRNGEWMTFTMSGLEPLNPDEPVCHVSHYEADAYARWADARLPTEIEWEHAASSLGIEPDDADNSGGTRRHHPIPTTHHAPLGAMFGDVWEWTSSPYVGYPGFRAAPGAVGEYNGKFMSGQMVLRGGSCATPVGHNRRTYRNFFPPAARWHFGGLRLARTTR